MVLIYPAAVMFVGALVYAFATGKVEALALKTYFAGVLVLTYVLANHTVRMLP